MLHNRRHSAPNFIAFGHSQWVCEALHKKLRRQAGVRPKSSGPAARNGALVIVGWLMSGSTEEKPEVDSTGAAIHSVSVRQDFSALGMLDALSKQLGGVWASPQRRVLLLMHGFFVYWPASLAWWLQKLFCLAGAAPITTAHLVAAWNSTHQAFLGVKMSDDGRPQHASQGGMRCVGRHMDRGFSLKGADLR